MHPPSVTGGVELFESWEKNCKMEDFQENSYIFWLFLLEISLFSFSENLILWPLLLLDRHFWKWKNKNKKYPFNYGHKIKKKHKLNNVCIGFLLWKIIIKKQKNTIILS